MNVEDIAKLITEDPDVINESAQYKCSACDRIFADLGEFKSHQNSQHECPKCHHYFNGSKALIQHMKGKDHARIRAPEWTSSIGQFGPPRDEDITYCPLCGKMCFDKRSGKCDNAMCPNWTWRV